MYSHFRRDGASILHLEALTAMGIEELTQRWSSLKEKRAELVSKRDTLKGRLEAEKEQLKKVVDEIKAKGYEPKELANVLKTKEQQLKQDLDEFEANIVAVEAALQKFDNLDL